ncbi:MAG: efflux RND transporter periplasmic adaptor subunit [Verrucomicrobiota bacterium]
MKKIVWNAGRALAVLCVGGVLISCGKKTAPTAARSTADRAVPVTVAIVKTIPMDRTLAVVGTLYARDEATIAAQVEGQVEKTKVDFGDRVTADQELALINTTTYDALLQQAEANLAKVTATATNAIQTLHRIQTLQKEKISAQSELDQAISQAGEAEADIKSAEATVAVAKLNLEHSKVRAPFDGAIAERIASAGDFMQIGSPLFRIVNDRVLKFIVQAPESYADLVKKEQIVTFGVDAFPTNRFQGKVFLISPQVNIANRSFSLGALVQNPDHKLRANTFARGELILEKNVPTEVVPLDAIVNFAGVNKVFVVTNEVAQARDVGVGRVKESVQEILSGLKAGETVVLSGQSKIQEGTRVRIKTDVAPDK